MERAMDGVARPRQRRIGSGFVSAGETKIGKRLGQGDLDVDLARVDLCGALQQPGHQKRERYDEGNHDQLQADPWKSSPVNVRALDFLGSDPTQVEQGKAEWRMHERS